MATLSLDTVTLEKGGHASIDDGVCAMEMVAFLAGEPHSDSPACTSPILAAFGSDRGTMRFRTTRHGRGC